MALTDCFLIGAALLLGLSVFLASGAFYRRLVTVWHTAQIKAAVFEGGVSSGKLDCRQRIRLLAADLLRNGLVFLRQPRVLLCRNRALRKLFTESTAYVCLRFPGSKPEAVAEVCLAVGLLSAVAVIFLTQQVLLGFLALVLPTLLLKQKAERVVSQRLRLFQDQLPDALQSVSMAFGAGYSLQQAIAQAAVETSQPISDELRLCAQELQTGSTVEAALDSLTHRVGLPALRFVAVALEVQHRTGGSIKELLQGAITAINQELELARTLRIGTAQAKLSAKLVVVLPFILVVILSLVMPGYLQALFGSPLGWACFAVAVVLITVGVLTIRRVLKAV